MPPSKRTIERLRRLLAVVPYVVRHPGTRVADLSRMFGVTEEEVIDDLNLLFLTGLPPYGPGDLIDVRIEEGRVWMSMADHFSRPVRLTRSEAVALYLRGTEVLGSPGVAEAEALRSALDKLARTLGEETLGALRAEVGDGGQAPAPLDVVRTAARAGERLEIDYYSASRDRFGSRRIDPEQVFSALGNWYVAAWDVEADDERLFRVDRIRDARPTGERFEHRGLLGQGRDLYSPGADDIRVRLLLGPGARWVAEYYAMEHVRERGDRLEATFPTKDLAWVGKLVLRLGGEAEIAEPADLRDLTRDLAAATLGRYGR
ncbi:MAG TPA: WYL domain-containing protein [Actinomycetota bacterium]|nr:WYL domain-containing protein [Actinomycetota bacterium]